MLLSPTCLSNHFNGSMVQRFNGFDLSEREVKYWVIVWILTSNGLQLFYEYLCRKVSDLYIPCSTK